MEGNSEMRNNDDQNRNGRDNSEGASNDNLHAGGGQLRKRKRLSPQQIVELEAENVYPDEIERSDLSKRLGLDIKSVTYWFQNRRTKLKMEIEWLEHVRLKEENKKLRAEYSVLKQAMEDLTCNQCGAPIISGDVADGPRDERGNHNV